nr:MAG TPA: hypothetical protein [Caudoviricetes sp.]
MQIHVLIRFQLLEMSIFLRICEGYIYIRRSP